RVEGGGGFGGHGHERGVAAQAGGDPCPDNRAGAEHVVGCLYGDGEDVGAGEGVFAGPGEVSGGAAEQPVHDAVGVGEEGVAAFADEQPAGAGLDGRGGGGGA